jgi:hypothetical protein
MQTGAGRMLEMPSSVSRSLQIRNLFASKY